MKKLCLAVAGALALTMLLSPVEASARGFGGSHHGGGHHGGGGHAHFGHAHFGQAHFGHRGFGRRAFFARPHFHGPRFVGRPYGWRGPRRVFIGGPLYRPYPAFARPRFGYGFGPGGCSTRRSVSFLPGGWRKIVTVRTCYVR